MRLSLREWFKKRTSGRLFFSNLTVLAVGALLIAVISQEGIYSREAAVADLTQTIPRAIIQQNRPMVEAIMLSFGKRIQASSLGICFRDHEVINVSNVTNYCDSKNIATSLLRITRQVELPGLFGYRVHFEAPLLPHSTLILWILLASCILISLNIILMRQVRLILWRDLIEPLQGSGLENVKIIEVYDLLASKERAVKGEAVRKLSLQVAHDIRSPISALKVLSQSATELNKEQREMLLSVSKRIDNIAEDLLRSEGRKSSLQAFDLREAIIQVTEEKKCELGEALIEITLDGDDRPLAAFGDSDVFKRVFSNILNNAVEASDRLGKIKIATSTNDKYVSVIIQDNGRGIKPSVLARLGLNPISTKRNGHGLGIIGAMEALQAWGGSLTFSANIGAGTSACLQLLKV